MFRPPNSVIPTVGDHLEGDDLGSGGTSRLILRCRGDLSRRLIGAEAQ